MGIPPDEFHGPVIPFVDTLDKYYNCKHISKNLDTMYCTWAFGVFKRKSQKEMQRINDLKAIVTPE